MRKKNSKTSRKKTEETFKKFEKYQALRSANTTELKTLNDALENLKKGNVKEVVLKK